MRDPYLIDGPTCLSFSGGRTSAYMLRQVLDANTREDLDRWLVVAFANTGKEEEATLRFVRECGERWSVPIVWLEYRTEEPGFAVVSFETASRNGEPFEAIVRKRQYLPNPVTRFCTSELKIRPMHKYLRSLGWADGDNVWDQFIGIRADEHTRVAKIRARGVSTESVKETMCMPLADAGVTMRDVADFWSRQPFRLGLSTDASGRTTGGNCDLCFLKPAGQILSLISERPSRAGWWVRIESLGLASAQSGARFRNDRPAYARIAQFAAEQRDMFADAPDEAIPCFCGD